MAKAKPLIGLDAHAPVSLNLPLIFSVRIAELWFWAVYLPDPAKVRELHDMRIAAKRLRYCFEFFQPLLGKELKEPLELFKRLQDYLGEIHDCDVWVDYLRDELDRAFSSLRKSRKGMGGYYGADPKLGAQAAGLAAQLREGPAQGLLLMIAEVVERRSRLYEELREFWHGLEARDFRSELMSVVARQSIDSASRATLPASLRPGADATDAQSVSALADTSDTTDEQLAADPAADARHSAEEGGDAVSGTVRGALDLGSNSIKLLVARQSGGGFETLLDLNEVTGLGSGVSESGKLSPASIKRTLAAVKRMLGEAKQYQPERISAVGTAALRSANNPEALLDPLRELGVDARVLSGEEEAELGRRAALRELPAGDVLLFDTGGGSTELSWVREHRLITERSLPLGARRLTELAGITHPVSEAQRAKLRKLLRAELAGAPQISDAKTLTIAGLGGTATAIAWMRQGERGEQPTDPHGAVVTLQELTRLQQSLGKQSMDAVLARPNLDPLRADVIYAGVAIIAALLKHYGAAKFTLVDRGLRFGLLFE